MEQKVDEDIQEAPTAPATPQRDALGRSSTMADAGRYWWVVVVMIVLGAAVALAAAQKRTPKYKAEAQIVVGQVDLQTQSLPSYAQGVIQLSTAYSRIATSQQVALLAGRDTGRGLSDVRGAVEATPVPQSPVFKITAQGPTVAKAVSLDNSVVSHTLTAIKTQVSAPDVSARRAFVRFQAYTRSAARYRLKASRLASGLTAQSSAKAQTAVVAQRAKAAQAQLLADTYGAQYTDARNSPASSAKGASVISRPIGASSDRSSFRQKLLVAGVLAGGLVGVAIALLLAERRGRRRLRS